MQYVFPCTQVDVYMVIIHQIIWIILFQKLQCQQLLTICRKNGINKYRNENDNNYNALVQ